MTDGDAILYTAYTYVLLLRRIICIRTSISRGAKEDDDDEIIYIYRYDRKIKYILTHTAHIHLIYEIYGTTHTHLRKARAYV